MADPAGNQNLAAPSAPRHSAVVRFTHWITALCFLALLLSGVEVLISHPRFYWGETGNVFTTPLFQIPIPASRPSVQTGYGYVLPDQNGWSRSLHFQAAWATLFAGALYVVFGLFTGHFRKNLLPAVSDLKWASFFPVIVGQLRFKRPSEADASAYTVLQRFAYLSVVFILFPLMIWTGLAMSPAITSGYPGIVTVLGGHQSACTIHFFGTVILVLFVIGHLAMVILAGFTSRVQAMITGRAASRTEHP